MKYILLLVIAVILTNCSSVRYQSPEDYYRKRTAEDSIDWGPNSNNNILDSQDGSTYYNRRVEIFGATY